MEYISELACRMSLGIIAGLCAFAALVAIVLWSGGTISKIALPSLFEIELKKPIVFSGNRFLAVIAAAFFTLAALAAVAQTLHPCTSCDGLPGQTAWIYAGHIDMTKGQLSDEPVVESEVSGTAVQAVQPGTWIRLTKPRRTMILDYDTQNLKRALDRPFQLNGKVTYTCKLLPTGTRLFVADKKINGPNRGDQNIWFRVRLTAVGE